MKGKTRSAAPKKKAASKDKAPQPKAPEPVRGTMKMPAVQKPVSWPVPKKERPR